MKILQKRESSWWRNQLKIVNKISDLKEAIIDPDIKLPRMGRESQVFLVMESYEETVNYLLNCFGCFIRFADQFKRKGRYIYYTADSEFSFANCQNFIGKANPLEWKSIREEMRKAGCRTIIIERDYYIMFSNWLVVGGVQEFKQG
jgi:hypothetical protein